MKQRIVAYLLIATVTTLGCETALAETTKHERVFVVADADGTVKSITDNIRLENADELDEIEDATLLTDIQNVGGKEAFTVDGERLTWEAEGKDITYQGTSEKTPAILPVVTLTLDGQELSVAELRDKTGEAVLTVTYETAEELPALAVTLLPLPEEGISGLELENAAVLNEMGREVLVGWAVPGADEELELPASFKASFHAEHADLDWMMTLTSSDPIDLVCRELDGRIDLDLDAELETAKQVLTALKEGETLPEAEGKIGEIVPKINELNDGLAQLDEGALTLADGARELSDGALGLKDGAAQLDEGAKALVEGTSKLKDGTSGLEEGARSLSAALTELSDGAFRLSEGAASLSTGAKTLAIGTLTSKAGASSLEEGLTELTANNDSLNEGAQALFEAVLDTANQQLAASGLEAAGITLPELTAENYGAVLDGVLEQLNPEALGENPEVLDEAAAAQLAMAQAAFEALSGVKAQLDQVNSFVTGLKAYTEGAKEAADGAQKLHTGLTKISAGAAELSEGTSGIAENEASLADGVAQAADGAGNLLEGAAQLSTGASDLYDGAVTLGGGVSELSEGTVSLYDGSVSLRDGAETLQETGTGTLRETILEEEKNAAEKLLPYVEGELSDALRIYEATRDNAKNSGYDLRPEEMKAITAYVIRTDL